MIEISNITKRFGALTAVDDVSFSVGRGEVLGFLGPNGAGKSTTMKMLTGFLRPDRGTIRIGGVDIAANPVEVKRWIGYLPEGAPLYGEMTTRGFLRFIAGIRGFRGADADRRIEVVVEKVSLESVLEMPIDTLSKGFKRRVGLAQAILHDPRILILDEPTDGLDPNQKHEVRALIHGMSAEKVIVLSTHILEEVDAVCTRATIIAAGRIVSDGTPEELLRRSRMHNALRLSLAIADGNGVSEGGMVETLESVPDVSHAEVTSRSDGALELLLLPAGTASLAGPVSAAAHAHGWHVTEMHVERGRLDDVFRAITTGAGDASDE
jgi:ABC-2 type transport system ATP-binding protein